MADDNVLHYFGTALPQLQIDDLPAKRAPYVEEQVAKDEYGRRRFHGAFTGGFSAGHWNTVGSQEGWEPQDYTSSRNDRAPQRQSQRPEDFMDAEDLGEFGIAPQRIQAQDDFAVTKTRKRKFPTLSSGPIPGIPVLEQICAPVQDKIAIRILKSMGWRPGQGIGPRQTLKQKKTAKKLNTREMYLMEQYGFQPQKKSTHEKSHSEEEEAEEEEDESEEDEQLTFAPEDYDPFLVAGKENRFGLGYTGLARDAILGGKHFTLFEPMQIFDKTQQRKFTISGQAFGVGALEEEDEDIYTREDMTNYDFSLDENQRNLQEKKQVKQDKHIVEGFVAAQDNVQYILPYRIDLPSGWKPRNWSERKSRFAPLEREVLSAQSLKVQKSGLGRHEMTPSERGEVLNEITPEVKAQKLLASIFEKGPKFETENTEKMLEEVQQENKTIMEKCSEKTKDMEKSGLGFQPFKQNAEKQERYEQFLASKMQKEDEIRTFLNDIQPIQLSAWEREMEMKEFIQARKIYKPLDSIMADRFVTEGCETVKQKVEEEAGQQKIKIERSKNMWKPCSALCKRYNIPEPYGKHEVVENELETQLKNKNNRTNIFDFISLNKKSDFQTPVIIPKHLEATKIIEPTKIMGLEQMKATLKAQEVKEPAGEMKIVMKKAQFKPQTELEKRVEDTKHVAVEQKQELYKAIFDSDDESEVELKEKVETLEKDAEILENAKKYNLVGNNSPPRGIFSALFQAQQEKSVIRTEEKIQFQARVKVELEPEVYGPAVPDNLVIKNNIIEKQVAILDDEWVEKDVLEGESDSSSEESEKHKKLKKSKHKKHKKHSKHKKHKKRKNKK